MKSRVKETRESFNFQWGNLKDSPWLLSEPRFKEECDKILLDELGLTHEDIVNKLVIDVGCGNGRWSYAFKKLGASVSAYDYSLSGVKQTKRIGVDVVLGDALHPPFRQAVSDLVFAFGVFHHTKDLEASFKENAKLVKPKGIMHVYLYGAKSMKLKLWRFLIHLIPSFGFRKATIAVFCKIRTTVPYSKALIPFSDVHGGFDALSPKINIETDEKYVEALFKVSGFSIVRRIRTTWCNWKVDNHMQGIKR